jgi:hypothetical protein
VAVPPLRFFGIGWDVYGTSMERYGTLWNVSGQRSIEISSVHPMEWNIYGTYGTFFLSTHRGSFPKADDAGNLDNVPYRGAILAISARCRHVMELWNVCGNVP